MERDLMDWRAIGRRLVRVLLAVAAIGVVGPAVSWLATGTVERATALPWVGAAALLLVVGAVLVVGVSAVRGMLRADDRGDRLAGRDVGLLPPQARSGSRDGRAEP